MEQTYTYKPLRFYLIAILSTWVVWAFAVYLSYLPGAGAEQLRTVLELAGLYGPLSAALLLIFTSQSPELKQDFFNRLINLKYIKLSTIPIIFLIIPAAMAISVVMSYFFFGQPLSQLTFTKTASFNTGFLPIPVMLFGAALVEELGWKGYGADSLRGNRTFLTAVIIYGALWASWHIPLCFINGYYHNLIFKENPLFGINFFVSVFPMALISNWLWFKNRGNILAAVLVHSTANSQGLINMGQVAKCIETVVLIIFAVVIVLADKKVFFGKFPALIGWYGQDTPDNK